jgi:drug/metabolite transporter (DMT)-like permease
MSPVALGAMLAVAASVALNGGFLLQHVGASTAPAITAIHPLRTLRGLLSARAWVLGGALGIGGWALHIAALAHAPLSLVQAVVAGGLALTVPAARRWLRRPIARSDVAAVVAMAAALAVLSGGVTAATGDTPAAALAPFGAFVAVVAGVLASAGLRRARPALLAAAGGVLYGAADVAIKQLTQLHGAGSVLLSPWLAFAGIATCAAFFAFQRALQQGSAVAAIALMTAGTYLVSIAGGVVLLGDSLGRGVATTALHTAALIVVIAAAYRLARSQAALTAELEAS